MKFEVCQKENASSLYNFLCCTDTLFPIPLSEKTDLFKLAEKLLENGRVFTAVQEGKIIGAVGMYANDIQSKTAYISVVAVLPEYSGKGIATSLIKNAIDFAETSGMDKINLYTHKTNSGAIHMYKKMGFVPLEDPLRPNDILFTMELNH